MAKQKGSHCYVCHIPVTEDNAAFMVGDKPSSICKRCNNLCALVNVKRDKSKEDILANIARRKRLIVLDEVMLMQFDIREALDDEALRIPTKDIVTEILRRTDNETQGDISNTTEANQTRTL